MKRKKSIIIDVIIIFLCISAFLVYNKLKQKSNKNGDKIRIGCISPFSGNGAVYGEQLKRGFQIALDELAEEDNLFYKRIKIIYEDDKLDSRVGVSAIQKLIEIDKIHIIIGPFTSNVALAIAPIAEEKKKIMVIPTATNYKIKDAGDYIFRICPSDDIQGKFLADYAINILNKEDVSILYMNTDYGVGLKNSFSDEFKSQGGKVVVSEAFEMGAVNFQLQLTKVKASDVSLIFFPSNYKEAAVIIRQAKELNISAQFMGTDGTFEPKFLELTRGASEGMLITTMAFNSDSTIVEDFRIKYKEKFKIEPSAYSALCYDALKVIIKCLKESNSLDSTYLKAFLNNISYNGVTGVTMFDNKGEVNKKFSIYEVKNGKFIMIK